MQFHIMQKVWFSHYIVWTFNSMDCSLPDSSVHGISQARILEWVAIPFSRGSSSPEIEPASPAWQVDSLSRSLQGNPREKGHVTVNSVLLKLKKHI